MKRYAYFVRRSTCDRHVAVWQRRGWEPYVRPRRFLGVLIVVTVEA